MNSQSLLCPTQDYQVGDIIKRRMNMFADHYGVFFGSYEGTPRVFDISRKHQGAVACFQIITLGDFEAGCRSECVRAVGPQDDIAAMFTRMKSLLESREMRYNVMGKGGWNCEHVARFVVTGTPLSTQVAAVEPALDNGKKVLIAGAVLTGVAALFGACRTYFKEKHSGEEQA